MKDISSRERQISGIVELQDTDKCNIIEHMLSMVLIPLKVTYFFRERDVAFLSLFFVLLSSAVISLSCPLLLSECRVEVD